MMNYVRLMRLIFLLGVAVFGLCGLFGNDSHAQAKAGTYSIMTLGTAGSHAEDPGSSGTMTVFRDGRINGSAYSYDDGQTSTFSGKVNLATGRGTVTESGRVIDVTFKTSTRTFIAINYAKRESSSRGIIWGVR